MTVGSGIKPDLLTFPKIREALAGSSFRSYRRWGVAPRPENLTQSVWREIPVAVNPPDGGVRHFQSCVFLAKNFRFTLVSIAKKFKIG